MTTLRVIFMGTPQFAVPSLETLAKSNLDVTLVVTAPDAPAGRGRKIQSSAVKNKAEELGLSIFQPEHANSEEAFQIISASNPNLIAVVAFGQRLHENLLELPQLGCINVHPSLLPKFRGAAPIQHAIMNDENLTGVSTIFMNEKMDSGDILLQREIPIEHNDTGGTLSHKLSEIGAELLIMTLNSVSQCRNRRVPQVEAESTLAPALYNTHAKITWSEPAIRIHNLVRALNPRPGAQTLFGENLIKIWSTHIPDENSPNTTSPGTIVRSNHSELWVATGKKYIAIDELQSQGRKKLPVKEWLRGTKLKIGQTLTSNN